MGKGDEMRICRVHDHMMILRPDGFHCEDCKKLSAEKSVVVAACPHCHETLLMPRPEIEGLPPVCLQWQNAAGLMGQLYVSSKRGSTELISVPPISNGEVLQLFCPYCKEALPMASDPRCPLCGAGVVVIDVKYPYGREGRSKRWVCTCRGCPGHHFGEEGPSIDAQVVSMMARREFDTGGELPG